MTRPVNLRNVPLPEDPAARDGHRFRRLRLGDVLDSRLSGFGLYELPPGEKAWPYHYELQREEWLIVVAGETTLRTPEGERRVGAGEIVCFPVGAPGAHAFRNDTDKPVRFAIASSRAPSSHTSVQPDGDKLLVHDGDRRRIVRASPELDYWDGER